MRNNLKNEDDAKPDCFCEGVRIRFAKSDPQSASEFFGCSQSLIHNNTGSRSRIFCPTPIPEVQLEYFLHRTLILGIPVEIVQFLLKLLLK